jgi:predicted alpha/beta-hydrolase family hydrolase
MGFTYTLPVELKVYPTDHPAASLVLAHGAGAGQTSSFMVRTGAELSARGITVATFDFPYMTAGRSVPDRAPVLEASWREAIAAAREQLGAVPLFIGGKSMGGRISSHVASQGAIGAVAGLVLLGYPLHPPGRPEQRRDAHLPPIAEPLLFVQGSRDTFGTADEMRALLPSLQRATLHEVSGGDHSFKVPGGKAKQEPAFLGVMDAVAGWIRSILSRPSG